jgi:hypothetical protein
MGLLERALSLLPGLTILAVITAETIEKAEAAKVAPR